MLPRERLIAARLIAVAAMILTWATIAEAGPVDDNEVATAIEDLASDDVPWNAAREDPADGDKPVGIRVDTGKRQALPQDDEAEVQAKINDIFGRFHAAVEKAYAETSHTPGAPTGRTAPQRKTSRRGS
jgi:hypothetical protein